MDLKQYVTIVPDYPKEGVQFKDITTLMDKGDVYRSGNPVQLLRIVLNPSVLCPPRTFISL